MKGLVTAITYPKKAFHVKEFHVLLNYGAGKASLLCCRYRDVYFPCCLTVMQKGGYLCLINVHNRVVLALILAVFIE
jgi:hypothetical protein